MPDPSHTSNVPDLMAHHRRTRKEASMLQGGDELAALLLPLALTVARLAARADARERGDA